MASQLNFYMAETLLEMLFAGSVGTNRFLNGVTPAAWPANLYLGLCSAVDTTTSTSQPRISAASGGEPDTGNGAATNLANGYSRVAVGPASSGGIYWAVVGGGSPGVIQNQGSDISFTHSGAASGSPTCGSQPLASSPWGSCISSTWTPTVFNYFFICEKPTAGVRSSDQIVLAYGPLQYPKPVYPGDTIKFTAGSVRISLAACP